MRNLTVEEITIVAGGNDGGSSSSNVDTLPEAICDSGNVDSASMMLEGEVTFGSVFSGSLSGKVSVTCNTDTGSNQPSGEGSSSGETSEG
ncbi:hypothetical protein [Kangiella sp.]|uniref:hypothetical protein n=1 Tax=Kangiella sp. TaxID=1920245 RepID=UPI0019B16CDF|nr:hypothetical protein [Kangiella sp.]MBD3654107.1 hypothetical protein [Kangiella sp.]